jgi:hypothetical protein
VPDLNRLVHGQSVVADTKQNIAVVQSKIDELIRQDADRSALVRLLLAVASWLTDRSGAM